MTEYTNNQGDDVVDVILDKKLGDRIVLEWPGIDRDSCKVCGTPRDAAPHHNFGGEEIHLFVPSRPIECVVAMEGISEGETYCVLHRAADDANWAMMWRGNWDGALKYYMGFIGDLEAEDIIEYNKAKSRV